MIKVLKEELKIIIKEEYIKMLLEKKQDKRVISKKYKGKTYKAPVSMKSKSWEEKVKMAKGAGADDPEAMAAAATIALKGKPASKD